MRRLLLIWGLSVIVILAGCGKESKAKNTVDDYLNSVKQGEDTEIFLDTGVEGLIDVFEYEHINTIELEKKKDTLSYEYDFWKEYDQSGFETFQEFKKEQKEIFSNYEIIQDTDQLLEIWDKKSYVDQHKFLYNVTLANEKGEKLFKKVEFLVVYSKSVWDGEDFSEGYHIEEINIR